MSEQTENRQLSNRRNHRGNGRVNEPREMSCGPMAGPTTGETMVDGQMAGPMTEETMVGGPRISRPANDLLGDNQ